MSEQDEFTWRIAKSLSERGICPLSLRDERPEFFTGDNRSGKTETAIMAAEYLGTIQNRNIIYIGETVSQLNRAWIKFDSGKVKPEGRLYKRKYCRRFDKILLRGTEKDCPERPASEEPHYIYCNRNDDADKAYELYRQSGDSEGLFWLKLVENNLCPVKAKKQMIPKLLEGSRPALIFLTWAMLRTLINSGEISEEKLLKDSILVADEASHAENLPVRERLKMGEIPDTYSDSVDAARNQFQQQKSRLKDRKVSLLGYQLILDNWLDNLFKHLNHILPSPLPDDLRAELREVFERKLHRDFNDQFIHRTPLRNGNIKDELSFPQIPSPILQQLRKNYWKSREPLLNLIRLLQSEGTGFSFQFSDNPQELELIIHDSEDGLESREKIRNLVELPSKPIFVDSTPFQGEVGEYFYGEVDFRERGFRNGVTQDVILDKGRNYGLQNIRDDEDARENHVQLVKKSYELLEKQHYNPVIITRSKWEASLFPEGYDTTYARSEHIRGNEFLDKNALIVTGIPYTLLHSERWRVPSMEEETNEGQIAQDKLYRQKAYQEFRQIIGRMSHKEDSISICLNMKQQEPFIYDHTDDLNLIPIRATNIDIDGRLRRLRYAVENKERPETTGLLAEEIIDYIRSSSKPNKSEAAKEGCSVGQLNDRLELIDSMIENNILVDKDGLSLSIIPELANQNKIQYP